MNNFLSVFVGVPQSRYAALAIIIAIVIVSLIILVSKDTIPVGQKFGFIFLVFLVSLPGLALSLFQLTCIVTGAGFKNQRWWCNIYAWLISLMMILYAIILVVAVILRVTSPEPDAYSRRLTPSQFNDMMQQANTMTLDALMSDESNESNGQQKSDAYVMHHQTDDAVIQHPAMHHPEAETVVQQQPIVKQQVVHQQPMMQHQNMMYQEQDMHNASDLYPMKTMHGTGAGAMYRPNPMTPTNLYNESFKVQGAHALPSMYPGYELTELPYAPGTEVNGSTLPMPTNSLVEQFYSGVQKKPDDENDGNIHIMTSSHQDTFII